MIFALSLFILFGVTGLAIDASRAYSVSMRVSSILDAAALAGAKLLESDTASDADIEAAAKAYFQLHTSEKDVSGLKLTNFKVVVDRVSNKVVVDTKVDLPTTFAATIGFTEFKFDRSSEVVMNMNKIELAVAPFSASVNAGALASQVSASPAVTTCGYTWTWGYTCTTAAGADVDTCVIERTNSRAFTDDAPTGADILPAVPSTPYGNYSCPSATVVPLQGKSQVTTIKNTINGYLASGATAGHIGAAWGWYLLSPKWASVLPSNSVPQPYSDKSVSKHVIFLTDGIFNTSFKSGSGTDYATQMNESYQQFQSLCANMKTAGITVYTVALDLLDARALTELSSCGGGNSFTAADGAQLKAVFNQIVNQLNKLRVSS